MWDDSVKEEGREWVGEAGCGCGVWSTDTADIQVSTRGTTAIHRSGKHKRTRNSPLPEKFDRWRAFGVLSGLAQDLGGKHLFCWVGCGWWCFAVKLIGCGAFSPRDDCCPR